MASRNLISKILSFFLAVSVIACAPAPVPMGESTQSVVDGSVITIENRIHNLPSVSVVKVNGYTSEKNLCTGVLIDKRFVLTAAHCLRGGADKVLRVVFEFATVGEKTVKVIRYQIHEGYLYTKGNSYDLALLLLEEDAPRGYAPAKLEERSFLTSLFQKRSNHIEFYGYGCGIRPYDLSDPTCASSVLRKGTTNRAVVINGRFSWKQDSGTATCMGDSGGPAFQFDGNDFYVVGIAATVADILTPDQRRELQYYGDEFKFYAVNPDLNACRGTANYTELSGHLEWIEDNQELLRQYIK